MPRVLSSQLTQEHAQYLLDLERDELRRLFDLHQEARLELIGRLSSLPGDRFSAQQVRLALAQVETAMLAMRKKLHAAKESALDRQLATSVEQTLAEIGLREKQFRRAQGRIQTAALRKLAKPKGLLLHQFDRSMQTYGLGFVNDMQRRLAVHALQKSTIRDVAIDIGGRLKSHGFRGSRWKAERIARTEMVDALNTGHQAGLEAAADALPDLKRQWDSTLDARTSDVCEKLNGQVKKLDEPWRYKDRLIKHPPALPNCRSRLVPWREEWAEAEIEEERQEGQRLRPKRKSDRPPKTSPSRRRSEETTRRKRVRDAENSIRANNFETAIVFNRDGTVFFRKRGASNYVMLSEAEARTFRGRVFTHNHPTSRAFSPEDVRFASKWGLAEIRATSRLYDHSLRPPADQAWSERLWRTSIKPAIDQADREVRRLFRGRIMRGEMTIREAQFEHWDRVWRRVSRRTGLRYSRRKVLR